MTPATPPSLTASPSLAALAQERDRLRRPLEARALAWLEGSSPASTELRAEVARVARAAETTVLLVGPPGAGKELVALAVHALSPRREAPFRRVHCPTAPEEARLALGQPSGGTLHLDAVEGLPRAQQHELARLLSAPAPPRHGAAAIPPRVVASTSADLERLCGLGRFDDELAYRLNVMSVAVPPLTERAPDLPTLLASFREAAGMRGRSPAAATAGGWRELWARAQSLPPAAPEASAPRPSDRSLRAREAAWIRQVLREEKGNRSRAARVLGINRSTLYKKLCDYALE